MSQSSGCDPAATCVLGHLSHVQLFATLCTVAHQAPLFSGILQARIQDWKRSVFIPIPKKGNAKEFSNYHTIALISHASNTMFKILQARLQQYVNETFQMYKLDFKKAEEPEIKLPTCVESLKKHLLLHY